MGLGPERLQVSNLPHDMASHLRHSHDPADGSLHHHSRLEKEGSNDRSGLPPRYRANRCFLQHELDLLKRRIPPSVCRIHPNVEGTRYFFKFLSHGKELTDHTPVVVLLVTWVLGMQPPSLKTLANVSIIVLGVMIASVGEIKFVLIGFLFQMAGVFCEATRLAMVERLLSGGEFKMDPLVSLYYFAPACASMNFVIWLFIEMPKMSVQNIMDLGLFTLLANASIAFMLNVAVVFLVSPVVRLQK